MVHRKDAENAEVAQRKCLSNSAVHIRGGLIIINEESGGQVLAKGMDCCSISFAYLKLNLPIDQ